MFSITPAAIFYAPHPDDETLAMAGAIRQHLQSGCTVIIVILTVGESSNAINKLKTSPYNVTLTTTQFSQARVRETKAAMMKLGVSENNFYSRSLGDGHVSTDAVKTEVMYWERLYPYASHKVIYKVDPNYTSPSVHTDHCVAYNALYELFQAGKIHDLRSYKDGIYSWPLTQRATAHGTLPKQDISDVKSYKRLAGLEFKYPESWNPAAGRYSIGYVSVATHFDSACFDKYGGVEAVENNEYLGPKYGPTTPPSSPPSAPTSLSYTCAESGYGVIINWPAVSGAVSYDIARKLTTSTEWTYWFEQTTANVANIPWPGMYHTPGSTGTYQFKVRARNASGVSAWVETGIVTIPVQTIPATPTGLSATALSSSQIRLSWNTVSGVTGYTIYCSAAKTAVDNRCSGKISTTTGAVWRNLAYITDGDRTNTYYSDSPATSATELSIAFSPYTKIHKYQFRVWDGDPRIYRRVQAGWYDSNNSFAAPQGWRAYRTGGGYRVSSTGDANVSKLTLAFSAGYGNTVNMYNHVTLMEAHGGYNAKTAGTNYTLTNLTPGTTYYIRIDSYKNTVPETLSYSTSIIECITPQDPNFGNIVGYVYNNSTGLGNISSNRIGGATLRIRSANQVVTTEPTGTNIGHYAFSSMPAAVTYSVEASAQGFLTSTQTVNVQAGINNTLNFGLNQVSVDTTPPSNPTSCHCWVDNSQTVEITNNKWQNLCYMPYFNWAGALDSSSGINGYSVLLSTSATANPPNTVTTTDTEYQSNALAVTGMIYYLRVKTKDNAGNWSTVTTLFTFKYDNVSPSVPLPISPDDGFITTSAAGTVFDWTNVADSSKIVYRWQLARDDSFTSGVAENMQVNVSSYTLSSPLSDGLYWWQSGAADEAGNLSAWFTPPQKIVVDTLPPEPVATLTAITAENGDIILEWDASTDAASGIAYYTIYRSTTAGIFSTSLPTGSSLVSTKYVDDNNLLVPGITYYYQIHPIDNAGHIQGTGNTIASIIIPVPVAGSVSIINVSSNYSVISPNNDGKFDILRISYTLSASAYLTLSITNQENEIIKNITYSAYQSSGSYLSTWDGKDEYGYFVADGKYVYTIYAITPSSQSATPKTGNINIDTLSITPTLTLSSDSISPNNDGINDMITLAYQTMESGTLNFNISNSSNVVVSTFVSSSVVFSPGRRYAYWYAKDNNNNLLPEGIYAVNIRFTDTVGNTSTISAQTIFVSQNNIRILGYVYDASTGFGNTLANRIKGANCKIEDTEVISNSSGTFVFDSIQPGSYSVYITYPGYQPVIQQIDVVTGQNLILTIGILQNSGDTTAPGISVSPIPAVEVYSNKIRVYCYLTDDVAVSSASITYRIKNTGVWTEWKTQPAVLLDETKYIAEIPANDVGYACEEIEWRIIAVDTSYNINLTATQATTVKAEHFATASPTNNTVLTLTDSNDIDGTVSLTIPPGAVNSVTTFQLKQLNPSEIPKQPVSAYLITPENTMFSKPCQLNLLYFDCDNDGFVDDTNIAEEMLGIFWYDGTAWRYLGGSIDTTRNTISVKITHLSIYAVFPVNTRNINANVYKPAERIFTPNTDGINDCIYFNGIQNYYASLSATASNEDKAVYIYNLANKNVRKLNNTDIWDGKDDNGNTVPSGVYIYQYKIDGKIISGTIVIAR
ncbi:MAG: FlgD immunoglobulin-like domain containing protein [Elusimicrobiota bacterium]